MKNENFMMANQDFMSLPVSIIEELNASEMILVKGGAFNDKDSSENSGTGCGCSQNSGTGCGC